MSEVETLEPLAVDTVTPADPFPPEEDRPCWRCYDNAIDRNGRQLPAGVYLHEAKIRSDAPATLNDSWCCAPLHIEAMTANVEDCGHGRLLRYRSTSGRWKQWAMPMHMLAGDGNSVLEVLLNEGLVVHRPNKAKVLDYISAQRPRKRLKAASTTGWHGTAFVLPDEVIGADDIWYQATERTAPYGTSGSLDKWRDLVAAPAMGNTLLMLSISAAFAGVLLERSNADGAGLHLFGDSSTGKTSILAAAISVWGGPAFRRTWRVTSNGLEGAARMHTGTLLALDEVGECAPRDLYESAYALSNGHGKTRANIRGDVRQVSRWRVFVLSTGEVTIASRMASGGYEAKAGQALRLLDVPIIGAFGAWDNLHGQPSGAALSDAIRDGAAQHYGHSGRAFVQALIRAFDNGLDVSSRLQTFIGQFNAKGGQESRAARIFAMCALAGELAIQENIVPWEKGQAADAAAKSFGLWREHRGADGRNAEDVEILRAVADFIDLHADSRFSDIDDNNAPLVRERAGYWKDTRGCRLYLFTSVGLKDATKGYDMRRVASTLDAVGAIVDRDAGRRSKKVRVPGGRPVSLYHIDPEKFGQNQI